MRGLRRAVLFVGGDWGGVAFPFAGAIEPKAKRIEQRLNKRRRTTNEQQMNQERTKSEARVKLERSSKDFPFAGVSEARRKREVWGCWWASEARTNSG